VITTDAHRLAEMEALSVRRRWWRGTTDTTDSQ
jgi:hypothetical protein